MKKYSSVFGLYVRNSIWKLVLVILCTVAAEAAFFYYRAYYVDYTPLTAYDDYYATVGSKPALWIQAVFESPGFTMIFITALVGLCILYGMVGSEFGAKTGFTIKRLRITEKSTILIHSIVSFCMYLVFHFSMVLCSYGFCLWYGTLEYAVPTNQTALIAYYTIPFFHRLLPLEDVFGWLWMLGVYAVLSFIAGYTPYHRRAQVAYVESEPLNEGGVVR